MDVGEEVLSQSSTTTSSRVSTPPLPPRRSEAPMNESGALLEIVNDAIEGDIARDMDLDIMEDSGFSEGSEGTMPVESSPDEPPLAPKGSPITPITPATPGSPGVKKGLSMRSLPGLKPLQRPEGEVNGGANGGQSPVKTSPGLRGIATAEGAKGLGQPGAKRAANAPYGEDVAEMLEEEEVVTIAESDRDGESDKGESKPHSIFKMLGTEMGAETRKACARVGCFLIIGVPIIITVFSVIFGAMFTGTDNEISFEDGFFIAASILTGSTSPLGGNATSPAHDGSRVFAIICGTWSMGIFGLLVVLFSAPALDPIFSVLRLR